MLEYNEIRERKVIIYDEEPYEVVSSHVFRKQQRKPVNATKLKNLLSGKVVEISFHVSDKVNEADLVKKEVKYLYKNKGEFWFSDIKDPSKRFIVPVEKIGEPQYKFLKENMTAIMKIFENGKGEEIIVSVDLPIKMEFIIKEAAPAVKGNTATNATKMVVLENGTEIFVPMFIETGEKIRINTEDGEYVERAN
jgi:elongation factor P